MFEIKYRDAMGRVGKFKNLETPILLPVVNPKRQLLDVSEIKKLGFNAIITNSYLIYKDRELKEKALKKGIHSLLNFDGIVMTDSGSYQLYEYGSIDVSPEEIIKFQEEIGSDIGVILDIPTPPDYSREITLKNIIETEKRGKKARKMVKKMLLVGTVQGSTYTDLRELSSKKMGGIDFDIYAIGGVVPIMENYDFYRLVKVIYSGKRFLPPHKPVHLFGCGHPLVFSLAVALGCDIFDSAAYALYAKQNRYITPTGTFKLEEMYEFPCHCEVCSSHTPKELLKCEDGEKLLAWHNLYVSIQEIKRIKQAIFEGSLWELLQMRCRAHPELLKALNCMLEYDFTKFDPITKKTAFFYSGKESTLRPEVKRHWKRLENLSPGKILVLLPEVEKPYSETIGYFSNSKYHVCVVSPVFGVIPTEVEDIYPLTQHEAPNLDLSLVRKLIETYAKKFDKVYSSPELNFEGEVWDKKISGDENYKIKAMADYLFGKGAGDAVFYDTKVERSKTGKIRRILSRGELIATLRPNDGFLILTIEGARRLKSLPYPRNRVVVKEEVKEFIERGKNVFAKFVVECDPEIVPYQEVIVVDEKDNLLATGTSLLNASEMRAFTRGIAVKVRHSVL